jgi:UDP-glucuronate decarboxylase
MKNYKNINHADIKEIVNNLSSEINKFNKKKILLLGSEGFLGKYFVQVFNEILNSSNNNFFIDCFDNFISSIPQRKKKFNKNIIFRRKNITNYKFKKKYDYIIYLAGIASPVIYKKYPMETLEVSYDGVKNLLAKVKKDKSKFIFFSSSEIYGNPDFKNLPTNETYYGYVNSFGPRSCYDEGKRIGETLCYIFKEYFNCSVSIVRPFNVFGPMMDKNDFRILPNIVDKIKNKKKILIHGNGTQTRTFCYITDAMTGFFKVILSNISGKIWNIGNPNNEINMLNLVKVINNISKRKNKYKLIKYPKNYPADEPKRRCPDISQAKKYLNFNPKVDIKLGIARMLKYNDLILKK